MIAKQNDRLTRLSYASWWLTLALLTYGLLSPQPPQLSEAILPAHLTFWASKGVHLGAFAGLAMVAGLLTVTPRHQKTLWAVLVVYAALTEYLQTFVEGRYGCFTDVCINVTGITLGVGLALGWRAASSLWARRPASATTTSTC